MQQSWIRAAIVFAVFASFTLVRREGLSGGESPSFKLPEVESKLLDLTNQERKKKELPALRADPLLCKIARAHSENMAKQGKMDHKLDDKTPFDRLRDADYKFASGGENIATGDTKNSLPEIMRAWMESKLHRDNILGAHFTEIGLGAARDKNGQIYYTQMFARPLKKG